MLALETEHGHGGVNANPLGTGKTIECAALMSINPRPTTEVSRFRPRATLILTTRDIVGQWQDRLAEYNPSLQVRVFGGTGSVAGDVHNLEDIQSADAVIVDLGVIPKEVHRMSASDAAVSGGRAHLARQAKPVVHVPIPSLLSDVEWWRVIVDEVQFFEVKSAAGVLRGLHAVNRWVVSATPLKKGLRSIPGLMSFVTGAPLSDWADRVAAYDAGERSVLLDALRPLVLRQRPDILERLKLVEPQREHTIPTAPSASELLVMLTIALSAKRMVHGTASVDIIAAIDALRMVCLSPELVLHEALKKRKSATKQRNVLRAGRVTGQVEDGGRANYGRRVATPELVLQLQPLLRTGSRRVAAADISTAVPDLASKLLLALTKEMRSLATLLTSQLKHLRPAQLEAIAGVRSVEDVADSGLPLIALHENARVFEQSLAASDEFFVTTLRERGLPDSPACLICLEPIVAGDMVAILPCRCTLAPPLKAASYRRLLNRENVATCPTCKETVNDADVACIMVGTAAEREASRPERAQAMLEAREERITPLVRDLADLTSLASALASTGGSAAACMTSKTAALVKLLDDEQRVPLSDKVVVFTAIKEAIPVLKAALKTRGVGSLSLAAGGSRAATLGAFRTDLSCRALLLQAGDGTSGTASAGIDLPFATHIVLLDVLTKDVEEQCVKRVRRIGQEKQTTVWRITAHTSVDAQLSRIVAGGGRVCADTVHPQHLDAVIQSVRGQLKQLVEDGAAGSASTPTATASTPTARASGAIGGRDFGAVPAPGTTVSSLGKRPAAGSAPVVEYFARGHCSYTQCTLGANHSGLCSHERIAGKRRK